MVDQLACSRSSGVSSISIIAKVYGLIAQNRKYTNFGSNSKLKKLINELFICTLQHYGYRIGVENNCA